MGSASQQREHTTRLGEAVVALLQAIVTAVLVRVKAKQALAVSLGLFLLVLISRLPFVGSILYHWDSVNFAFAIERFDVAAGQPHIPGYILYVALARMVNALFQDAQLSLTSISVVGSALAAVAIYHLGRSMFDSRTGLVAALFLVTSPLYWFYGEIALPHSLDGFVVILAVILLYRSANGEEHWAIPAAIWIGIAGGLRPQTQVFLLPLAVFVAFHLRWRYRLLALAALVLTDLAWFIPLVWLSGGLTRYFELLQSFYLAFNRTTSILSGGGFAGVGRNLLKLGMYTSYAWSFAAIPLLIMGFTVLREFGKKVYDWMTYFRFRFTMIWIFACLVYYALVHMGQQGLVFFFLPALMLLSAAAFNKIEWARPTFRGLSLAAIVLLNTVIFVFAPTHPLKVQSLKLLTLDTLRRHDSYYLTRLETIRREFVPESTALLSSGWRFPEYYLPAFTLIPYETSGRWEEDAGSPTREQETWRDASSLGLEPDETGSFHLIVFDDGLASFNQSPDRQAWLSMANGNKMAHMSFAYDELIYLGPEGYGLVSSSEGPR